MDMNTKMMKFEDLSVPKKIPVQEIALPFFKKRKGISANDTFFRTTFTMPMSKVDYKRKTRWIKSKPVHLEEYQPAMGMKKPFTVNDHRRRSVNEEIIGKLCENFVKGFQVGNSLLDSDLETLDSHRVR